MSPAMYLALLISGGGIKYGITKHTRPNTPEGGNNYGKFETFTVPAL